MTFLRLVIKGAFRNRLRTTLTTFSVAIVIVAFLFLRTFIAAWNAGAEAAAVDRLIVHSKTSLTFPLPKAYLEKLKQVPGVNEVSWANWFGGVYKDPNDFLAQYATDAESYLQLHPEFLLTEEEKTNYLADRTGAIAGILLAEKYGWKIGDKIVLQGTLYSGDYEFTLRGIYRGREKNTDTQQFQFHWQYLNDRQPESRRNNIDWYVLKVKDPAQSPQLTEAIDKKFSNSLAETRTESEKSFQKSFLSMASAVMVAIQIVSYVIMLILLLLLGNTLAMSTREHVTEHAVMRVMGFRTSYITGLVIGEGFVVAVAGVLLGLLFAPPILKWFGEFLQQKAGSFLGAFELDPANVLIVVMVALAVGVLAAAFPAMRAGRLRIVDALRRVG